jgi:hypothetical protein
MSRMLLSTLCTALALGLFTGCRSAVKTTAKTAGRVTVAGAKAGARVTVEGAKITGGAVADVATGGSKDDKRRSDRK